MEGYCDTCWETGVWSTEAKVEVIVPKATWHRGSNSSVISDPSGEPCHTPSYIGLPSMWGSVDGDCFFPVFCGGTP